MHSPIAEQQRLEHQQPSCLAGPMLAQEVSRVVLAAIEEVENNMLGSCSFSGLVERQRAVVPVWLGMRLRGAVNDRLVVTKQVAIVSSRSAKASKSSLQVSSLIDSSACCNELTAAGKAVACFFLSANQQVPGSRGGVGGRQ